MCEYSKDQEPTLPKDFQVRVMGYNQALTTQVEQGVLQTVKQVSCFLPLNNLEGITIGFSYKEALSNVQQSIGPDTEKFIPTSTKDGEGVGMAIPIKRSNVLKTHIVFGPMLVTMMCNNDPAKAKEYTEDVLYHELAHAVDYENRFRHFGQQLLSSSLADFKPLEVYLWKLSHHIWDEYFANRLGTILSQTEPSKDELFLNAYSEFKARMQKARRTFLSGQESISDFCSVLDKQVPFLLRTMAYVLGENDALSSSEIPKSQAFQYIYSSCQEVLVPFHTALEDLWGNLGKWENMREFLILNNPTLQLLHAIGVFPRELPNGEIYLDLKYFSAL